MRCASCQEVKRFVEERWKESRKISVATESGRLGEQWPPRPLISKDCDGVDHTNTARNMCINGFLSLAQLISLCRRSLYSRSSILRSYPCKIHRTICHHARRPFLRAHVGASASADLESRRGAKSKSSMKLKDLPQGALKASKLEPYHDGAAEDDGPRFPAVMQGHRNNMQKFRNCVVLTRIGGFYEVRENMLGPYKCRG